MKENETNLTTTPPCAPETASTATTENPAASPETDIAENPTDTETTTDTAAENLPTLGEVLRIASLDPRVGHYIIDLLALEMRLFEDVSGVTDALQGKEAQAGVSATLYRQQTQNAVVALADLFETFNNFRTARDNKAVKLISI